MNREIQQQLQWVKLYEETGDAGFVCHRCGIFRPTLRKWWRRYLTRASLVWKATVVVLKARNRPKLVLPKSS